MCVPTLCCLIGLVCAIGCKESKKVRANVSMVVAGRQVKASVEGSGAFIQPDGEIATVRFRGHKVRVEKERVILDSIQTANIASNVTMVEVVVTKAGNVTVTADGAKVLAAKLRK